MFHLLFAHCCRWRLYCIYILRNKEMFNLCLQWDEKKGGGGVNIFLFSFLKNNSFLLPFWICFSFLDFIQNVIWIVVSFFLCARWDALFHYINMSKTKHTFDTKCSVKDSPKQKFFLQLPLTITWLKVLWLKVAQRPGLKMKALPNKLSGLSSPTHKLRMNTVYSFNLRNFVLPSFLSWFLEQNNVICDIVISLTI